MKILARKRENIHYISLFVCLFVFLLVFETGFLCIVLAVLELTL